jgi:hypothetical protein
MTVIRPEPTFVRVSDMQIHKVVLCLMSVTVICASVHAQRTATPIDTLRQSRPSTNWNAASARTADVDCDSKPDTVILGSEKGKVVVGVVWADHRQPQLFVFPIRRDRQDGFCAVPKRIDVTAADCESDEGPLPGCKAVRGCKAFSVRDDECDSFNFYWDATQKALTWWRM